MTSTTPRIRFGLAALVLACAAFMTAVLPVWIVPLFSPSPTAEQVVVDLTTSIKARLKAKAKGIKYVEPVRQAESQEFGLELFNAAAIVLGVLALIFSTVSLVAREPWRFGAAAACVGASAILFQFALLVVGALLCILLVAVVLNALGLGG